MNPGIPGILGFIGDPCSFLLAPLPLAGKRPGPHRVFPSLFRIFDRRIHIFNHFRSMRINATLSPVSTDD